MSRGLGDVYKRQPLVDGEIAVSKVYPTTKQMSEWTGVNLDLMPAK